MFTCCAFFPLSLFFVFGPMFAAGKGVRSFLIAIVVEVVFASLLLVLNFPMTIEQITSWRTNGLYMLPFAGMLLVPIVMGGVILYARHAESIDSPKRCRTCGYDLRATPERCPECGTMVKSDPERF